MSIKFVRLAYILIQIVQIKVFFTHLKLCATVARHNLKWVKN